MFIQYPVILYSTIYILKQNQFSVLTFWKPSDLALYCTLLYCITLHCIVLCYAMPCHVIYYIILHYTILLATWLSAILSSLQNVKETFKIRKKQGKTKQETKAKMAEVINPSGNKEKYKEGTSIMLIKDLEENIFSAFKTSLLWGSFQSWREPHSRIKVLRQRRQAWRVLMALFN